MIAEPPPVASLRLIPKSVSPAEVTVAVAGVWTLPRKKGSRLVKSARRSAGDAMTAVCGCHAPSGDSGVRSVQSRRTHCQIKSAPSKPTSNCGQISRGLRFRARSHEGSARGSRMVDPDISVAMWFSVPHQKKHLANLLGPLGANPLQGKIGKAHA